MEYFVRALKKYAEFSGRATRTEYWMYALFYMIHYVNSVFGPGHSKYQRGGQAASRYRSHRLVAADSLIPVIGIIVLIVFLVQDSHKDNDYGPNPKAA
jgi:uncharacterized membrane protein YhaH (DUF805 family)